LLRALVETDRLPHALLFYGPAGVGKEAAAIELAKTLNCNSSLWDACGKCHDCLQMAKLQHPRLKLVFPLPSKDKEKSPIDKFSEEELAALRQQIEAKAADPYHRIAMPKAQDIKISSIREIRHESGLRNAVQGRTVILICEADRMNSNSANALLKTLEEPGGEMLLILSTSRRDALLPTIISRCQQLRFDSLSHDQIFSALRDRFDVPPATLSLASQLANGSYAEALSIVTETSLIQRAEILEYLRKVHLGDPRQLMARINAYTAIDDKRAISLFLTGVAAWFRDVLALREGAAERILNKDFMKELGKFSEFYPDVRCGEAITAVEETIDLLHKNVHLVTALIALSHKLRRCMRPEMY